MKLLTLSQTLTILPFWAELHDRYSPPGAHNLLLGCMYRPCVLALDPANPPVICHRKQMPVSNFPRGETSENNPITSVNITNAEAIFHDRNHITLSADKAATPNDILLAFRLSVPHGLTGVRPVQVYAAHSSGLSSEEPAGLLLNRIFNDYSQSWKLRDGRKLLNIWGLFLLKEGEHADLLHVLPHQADLSTVGITNRSGALRLNRKTRRNPPPL